MQSAEARDFLASMQRRLTRGPHEALGVAPDADERQVRAAFLTLTKSYHPIRFARFEEEIVRLANEVFLGLRVAHETMAGTARRRPSTNGGLAASQPAQRSGLPRGSMPLVTSATLPPPVGHSGGSASAQPKGPAVHFRGPAPAAPRERTATTRPEVPEAATLEQAKELLRQRRWTDAKPMLSDLATMVPAAREYRALLSYTRGREHQDAGRHVEARLEFQRALTTDPALKLAEQALGELPPPTDTAPSNLWTRLRSKIRG